MSTFNKIFCFIKILIIIFTSGLFSKEEIFISITKEGLKKQFLPSNAIMITEEEIKNTDAKNVGELLEILTSYDLPRYGTLGSVKNLRIRNSTADQVLILLNGIPISGCGKGGFNLSLIPIEVIKKIEILPGSFSGLYGANAVGGVVNIITKTFTQEKPQILTNISYGSFNTYSLNGSFDYVSLPFGIKISLADIHSDGWRDNSKYDALSGYADFGVEMLHGKLNFNVLSKKSKLGIPGVSLVPMESWDGAQEKEASTPYAVQHDEFNFICLSFENNFITSKISYDTQGLIYDNSKDPFWPEKTDSKLNTFNFSNNVRLPYKFYGTLSYNYTVINQQYPLNTSYNFKKDVSNLGIGLQKELTFGGMNFIPTVRWDSNSLFGNKFSPQVVFVYNFQRIKLSFTSGTSWRAPTFLDLYWPDQIWTKGNPNLKPEESYSFDFAVESNLGNISFLFNPFYRYIKDQIRWYPENPQDMFSAWVPSNVDEAIVQGIEFKTEFSFKNIFNNKVSFLLSDNRIKKKEEAHKGWQKQAYSPLFSLIYNLELLLPYSFKFISFLKYVDSQYSRDGELGRKLKEYILWDIKFTKEVFKFINIYFQINDLLDQKGVNREGYPQPGRTYEGGIYFTIKI